MKSTYIGEIAHLVELAVMAVMRRNCGGHRGYNNNNNNNNNNSSNNRTDNSIEPECTVHSRGTQVSSGPPRRGEVSLLVQFTLLLRRSYYRIFFKFRSFIDKFDFNKVHFFKFSIDAPFLLQRRKRAIWREEGGAFQISIYLNKNIYFSFICWFFLTVMYSHVFETKFFRISISFNYLAKQFERAEPTRIPKISIMRFVWCNCYFLNIKVIKNN